MKRKCLNRILSILLVAAMVLSLGPTVLAAQEQRVPFRQVEADAPLEREPADIPQDTSYAPTDLVRVSIVLTGSGRWRPGPSGSPLPGRHDARPPARGPPGRIRKRT